MFSGHKKAIYDDTTQICLRVGNNQIDFSGRVYLTDGSRKVIKYISAV